MPTFKEVQSQVLEASDRKEILDHLVEYLEENFRASNGQDPPKLLVRQDRTPVSSSAFDQVVQSLVSESQSLASRIEAIMSMNIDERSGNEQVDPGQNAGEAGAEGIPEDGGPKRRTSGRRNS